MKRILATVTALLITTGYVYANIISDNTVHATSITATASEELVTEDGCLIGVKNKDITELHLDENITGISSSALSECKNLKTITMTNSVIFIGENAFALCPKLENVTLSSNVKIEENIFADDYFRDKYVDIIGNYAGVNLTFATDGIKIERDDDGNIVSDLNEIKADFHNSVQIKSISIPNGFSVVDINVDNCTNLESFTMTNDVEYFFTSFAMCPNLKNVVLSSALKDINERIFLKVNNEEEYTKVFGNYAGVNLTFATDGVKLERDDDGNILNIGDCNEIKIDFHNSVQIKSISIPNGFSVVDINVDNCTNLESFTMTNDVEYCFTSFAMCPNLKNVVLSSALKDINERIFLKVNNEEEYTKVFGNYAGVNLTFATDGVKLERDNDGNILNIGDCNEIKIDISDSAQIKSIDIPNGFAVAQIDLGYCKNLEKFSMSNDTIHLFTTFKRCPNLKNVVLSSALKGEECKSFFMNVNDEEEFTKEFGNYVGVNLTFAIDGVKIERDSDGNILHTGDCNEIKIDINDTAQIKSIDIPNGFTDVLIDLRYCKNLEKFNTSNDTIHLLTTFKRCPNLKSLTISEKCFENEGTAHLDEYLSNETGNTTLVHVSSLIKGDTDGNGIISSSDIITLTRNLLTSPNYMLSSNDINDDGTINIIDLILLKNIILK